MLTKLTLAKPFGKTPSTIKSPPSRALANYAKASESPPLESLDSVEISEKAKAQPQAPSGMRKTGKFVALGLSLVGVLGAVGCGAGGAAVEAQPQVENVQETSEQQAKEIDLRQEQTAPSAQTGNELLDGVKREGKQIHDNLKGKSAEEIAEAVGQEGRKVGQQVVKELKTEGQRLKETFSGKDAEEIAENIGKEGRRIGKQIGEEGKKVGQEAARVGKEVGKVAKGFWRGLTGKGKKN